MRAYVGCSSPCLGREPVGLSKPLKSATHTQCDARPTVTFPAAEHHRPLTGTKLYCSVTDARVCGQLAQGGYLKVEQPGVEPATFCVASQHANHYTTKPRVDNEITVKSTIQPIQYIIILH